MLTGTYVRPEPKELVGETALLRQNGDNTVLAQFNNLEKFSRHETDWAFGWHEFNSAWFELEENHEN